MTHVDRRAFLRASAKYASGAIVAPSLLGLAACNDALAPARSAGRPSLARAGKGMGGYGPLVDAGPELMLPDGFQYHVFGRTGDMMSDGYPTPSAHDGMACYADPSGYARLVRNHEVRSLSGAFGDASKAYDPKSGGGTTTLLVSRDRELVRSFASINGTSTNCAGGHTPWGTWLTCEETTSGLAAQYDKPHGYVFEVSAFGDGLVGNPEPYRAMGRFVHEAVAVDPNTGIVYLTEDQRIRPATDAYPHVLGSGFYRFIPDRSGDLRSGRLQMLALRGHKRGSYVADKNQLVGRPLPVTWVNIEDPDPANAESDPFAVAKQGVEQGAVVFARLEGCWWGDNSIYFVATSGGEAGLGQVWQYRPLGASGGQLMLIFESPSADVLDGPDNVLVTPRGGLILCEDGDAEQFLRGLTPRGEIFDFAKNRINDAEFAGACFSPEGETLFVNIQSPGLTLAIWGPWEEGVL
jgi:secreted PhoX family phosphatase